MRATLTSSLIRLRPSWVIHFGEQTIPVRWSSWYCQTWTWVDGKTYQLNMRHQNTIECNGEIVSQRSSHPNRSQFVWDGAVPVVSTTRRCSVWYRDPFHRLQMYAGGGCRQQKVAFRSTTEPASIALCLGIVMATFVNFD